MALGIRWTVYILGALVALVVLLTVVARVATGAYLLYPAPVQWVVRVGDSLWHLVTGDGYESDLGELLSAADVEDLTEAAQDDFHDALTKLWGG